MYRIRIMIEDEGEWSSNKVRSVDLEGTAVTREQMTHLLNTAMTTAGVST